jgi:hypothetical protein
VLEEFEFSEDTEINTSTLLEYNLKPRDILDIIPIEDLKTFVLNKQIKSEVI